MAADLDVHVTLNFTTISTVLTISTAQKCRLHNVCGFNERGSGVATQPRFQREGHWTGKWRTFSQKEYPADYSSHLFFRQFSVIRLNKVFRNAAIRREGNNRIVYEYTCVNPAKSARLWKRKTGA